MFLKQNPVGKNIYAWTLVKGQRSPTVDTCLISSHGARINERWSYHRSVDFAFYTPDCTSLGGAMAVDLIGTLVGKYLPCETLANPPYPDYRLSKFRDFSENYHDLGKTPLLAAQRYKANSQHYRDPISWDLAPHRVLRLKVRRLGDAKLTALIDEWGAWTMDVVTIRNRIRSPNFVLLSDLVRALDNAGYHYNRFCCFFCRSLFGDLKPQSVSPPARYPG